MQAIAHGFFSKNKYHLLVGLLLLVYLVNGLFYIPQQSLTADEADHLSYAMRFVKGHPEKIKPFDDASTMPVSALNTIPRVAEQLLHPGLQKSDWGLSDVMMGRYVTLLISLLIGLYVYRWSKDLFGAKAGLCSLVLFVFCPNIAAHAGLLTTDVYSALFTIIPLYHFRKYANNRKLKELVLFSLTIAVAQLCKQSLTFLYPVVLLLSLVLLLRDRKSGQVIRVKMILRNFFLFALIQLVVINAGFYFKGSGTAFGDYHFRSRFFTGLQNKFSFAAAIPLPMPTPYLEGLDCTKTIDEMGPGHPESSGYVYLLGETKANQGFWNYYFVVLFFKMPVPLLLALLGSLFIFFTNRKKYGNWNMLVLVWPVVFYLVYFNFFYNSQVGLRHILMIFPLLFVMAGLFFQQLSERRELLAYVLLIYSAATFYFYYPHLIPYTNEFMLNKKMAYRVMADSNLDYKQSEGRLQQWLDAKKGVYAPETPQAGTFIISVNDLTGVVETKNYKWLFDNFKPTAHLAFCYLIFEISEQDLHAKHLRGL